MTKTFRDAEELGLRALDEAERANALAQQSAALAVEEGGRSEARDARLTDGVLRSVLVNAPRDACYLDASAGAAIRAFGVYARAHAWALAEGAVCVPDWLDSLERRGFRISPNFHAYWARAYGNSPHVYGFDKPNAIKGLEFKSLADWRGSRERAAREIALKAEREFAQDIVDEACTKAAEQFGIDVFERIRLIVRGEFDAATGELTLTATPRPREEDPTK